MIPGPANILMLHTNACVGKINAISQIIYVH